MKYIPGRRLSDSLERMDWEFLCKEVGRSIGKLHQTGIIHGDLTNSNMIVETNTGKLYFIDFGLGFHSDRDEDKAVDIHLVKQALEARHHRIFEKAFDFIIDGYKKGNNGWRSVLKRLERVEKRGRYKAQY
jgi:TP53 regulating kinase-like protein